MSWVLALANCWHPLKKLLCKLHSQLETHVRRWFCRRPLLCNRSSNVEGVARLLKSCKISWESSLCIAKATTKIWGSNKTALAKEVFALIAKEYCISLVTLDLRRSFKAMFTTFFLPAIFILHQGHSEGCRKGRPTNRFIKRSTNHKRSKFLLWSTRLAHKFSSLQPSSPQCS